MNIHTMSANLEKVNSTFECLKKAKYKRNILYSSLNDANKMFDYENAVKVKIKHKIKIIDMSIERLIDRYYSQILSIATNYKK